MVSFRDVSTYVQLFLSTKSTRYDPPIFHVQSPSMFLACLPIPSYSFGTDGTLIQMKVTTPSERPSLLAERAATEMIRFQRRIFERQRAIIESNESHTSPGFSRYRNEYRKAVSDYSEVSGFGTLCDAVAASKIAYVADYHTLRLAQRTFVKLINGVMQQVDSIFLCLEFVPIQYQTDLDKFSMGRISEKTFLRRIRYRHHWPYDIWPNFKPIFDLAKDHGFPMIALDSDSTLSLRKRDALAAKRIVDTSILHPEATILVYVGQMHISPTHLPDAVNALLKKKRLVPPKRVIIYQNAEEIYWQLANERREGAEVVKIDNESFCINNTPPLVQQLSYLHWVRFDEELLEYTELESTVRTVIKTLGKFLRLPYKGALRNVRVLMPGDLDLAQALDNGDLTKYEKGQILASVESEESACIPSLHLIYLATLSLNHAAEEASHFLKQQVSGGEPPFDLKDRFYFYLLNEACGFFGSKLINPKRKTDHMGMLRRIVARSRKRKGKRKPNEKAAEFAMSHIAFEQGKSVLSRKTVNLLKDPFVFNAAAHILGYILGDKLYYGFTSGILSKKQIRLIFASRLDGPDEALNLYLDLSSTVRLIVPPHRI